MLFGLLVEGKLYAADALLVVQRDPLHDQVQQGLALRERRAAEQDVESANQERTSFVWRSSMNGIHRFSVMTGSRSEQTLLLKATISIMADDHMIEYVDAYNLSRRREPLRQGNVLLGGRRVATRMIV